ncbi:MAG TPA: HlyD family efflux transporter periplasmic adaptor subunit [Planctomycetota bacterium]|nr:HlyD family efflux transporter periplasmic adaptor subunit [Planctomycetota bacterium]
MASSRARSRTLWPLLILAALGVGGVAWATLNRGEGEGPGKTPTWTVRRGPLRITVTEGGSLQSLKSVTVVSEVESETKILSIVAEGTFVTPEDVEAHRVLVELDASSIEEKRRRQQITVSDAQSNVSQAQEALKIQENQNESDLRQADLLVKFARIDLQKYVGGTLATQAEAHTGESGSFDLKSLSKHADLEGEALQERRRRESEIDLAREEVARAKDKLRWTEELLAKGFVSADEQVADRLALKRQEVALDQATTSLDLFLAYEFAKDIEKFASDLREAKESYERAKSRADSALTKAKADLRGKEEKLELETAELQRYEKQIAACVIRAASPGLVVYASSEDRGNWQGDQSPIQQGATVRPRQAILVIPNPQSLGVRVNVHESVLSKVKVGLPAAVTVDALSERALTGKVVRVSTMPNAANRWQNPDLKVYATEVAIEDAPASLRPGMSAKVEILVGEVEDTLQVPVQAVTMASGIPRVWARDAGGDLPRSVKLGASSDRFVEVLDGLAEGDVVLLSPPREGPQTERRPEGEGTPPARDRPRGPRNGRPGTSGPGEGTPSAGTGTPSAGATAPSAEGAAGGAPPAGAAPRSAAGPKAGIEGSAPRPATEGAAGPRRP